MSGMSTNVSQTPVFSPPVSESYDCETAALVRACLCPLFDGATSWKVLAEGLATRGYGLAIRDGRLVVKEAASGRRICSVRYLGTNLRELSGRLGRPMVLARRDRAAAGEFLV